MPKTRNKCFGSKQRNMILHQAKAGNYEWGKIAETYKTELGILRSVLCLNYFMRLDVNERKFRLNVEKEN